MAGYGLRAFLIAQSLNQIDKAYGPNHSILDNCHVRIAFETNDERTAKRISECVRFFRAVDRQWSYWLHYPMPRPDVLNLAVRLLADIQTMPVESDRRQFAIKDPADLRKSARSTVHFDEHSAPQLRPVRTGEPPTDRGRAGVAFGGARIAARCASERRLVAMGPRMAEEASPMSSNRVAFQTLADGLAGRAR